MSFVSLLQQEAQAPFGANGSMLMTIAPIVLVMIIFYFLIMRPQNKRQKEIEQMRNSLQKGDKVVTIGGIHGTVGTVKEKTVIVKVEDGTKIEFDRSAVATVVSDRPSGKSDKKDAKPGENAAEGEGKPSEPSEDSSADKN